MNPNCSKALLRLACADGAILSTSIVPLYLVVVVVVVFVTTVVFTVLVLEPFFPNLLYCSGCVNSLVD